MRSRLLIGAAFAALLALSAMGQAPPGAPQGPDFAQFLTDLKWDAARSGPLVAVVPLVMMKGTGLEAFGRKTVTVGGLTAVVPLRMASVDTKFVQAPNLYEGLPQEAKVLYLLRSLSPGQWQKATGDGLGFADLQGEQTAVFDSIVPDPFNYVLGTIVDSNAIRGSNAPEDQKSLAGNARRGIRLRVVRHLELHLPVGTDGGFTGTSMSEWKIGARVPHVMERPAFEFGHKVLVESPNVPRPSDLNLGDGRLGATISLKNGENVKALLERIAAATGVRIIADPHYARMPLFTVGEKATARDLLGALSLGVCGTHRRVGDAYVLTSDLVGMAAHQARLAAWEDALKKEVDARKAQWRKAIVESGGFARIGLHGSAAEGLTDAERSNMAANDGTNNAGPFYIPVTSASRAVQDAVKNFKYGVGVDRSRVGVHSSIRFEVVLPDGSTMWWAGWLGNAEDFTDKPYVWAPPNPKPVALPLAPTPRLAGLVLHADAPDVARALVARTARLGLKALWLETRSPEALAAAVAAGREKGVKVALALRPWSSNGWHIQISLPVNPWADGGTSVDRGDSARTVTGLHGKSLANAKAALSPWLAYWQETSAFEPPTREVISPLDPARSKRTADAARLAAVPGLAGVALLDLYPTGYARGNSRASGSYFYSLAIDNLISYGYSDAERMAFVDAERIDPLDLENPIVNTDVDLRPAWNGAWTTGGDFDRWQKARGTWAHDAALGLVRAVAGSAPGVPILLPGQPAENHVPPYALGYLTTWTPGTDLPVAPIDYIGNTLDKLADLETMELRDEKDPALRNRVADALQKRLATPGKPLALDLTAVPADHLEAVIARWLKDK